jgi:NADH:ubiquinone oxidoreductase subunit H
MISYEIAMGLALVSVVLTTGDLLTWAIRSANDRWYPGHGTSDLAKTVWVWLGANRIVGAAAVYACAVAALSVQPITYRWTARGAKPSRKLPPETGTERLSS